MTTKEVSITIEGISPLLMHSFPMEEIKAIEKKSPANGGKMLAKDARQRLGMDKASFSRLLSAMRQEITVKKFHLNKRQNVISLKG